MKRLTAHLLCVLQCLPRPDTTAALAAADQDNMMLDASAGGAGGSDPLLPSPGPEAAAKLGSTSDLQFFAAKMRDVCSASDEMVEKVKAVLAVVSGDETGGAGGGALSAGRSVIGAEEYMNSLESVELLNRQLKAYLANL